MNKNREASLEQGMLCDAVRDVSASSEGNAAATRWQRQAVICAIDAGFLICLELMLRQPVGASV